MENVVRKLVIKITDYLPVKIIRDDHGVPFLYRYQLLNFGENGPGICIHHFVKSDPDRGYHDHPWSRALSFILCGRYEERLITKPHEKITDVSAKLRRTDVPSTITRNRWQFNYLDGVNSFHRVMIAENQDAWTLFFFQKRSKTWGMIGLDGKYKAMSTQVKDTDGGWWKTAKNGFSFRHRIALKQPVVSCVDIVLLSPRNESVLLIKRGKAPFKDAWAFPGGRIEGTDQNLLAAAERELKEETNITDVVLNQTLAVGNNSRDPRGFSLSVVFVAHDISTHHLVKAGDDAVDAAWFHLDELPEMAFDHRAILAEIMDK